MKENNL